MLKGKNINLRIMEKEDLPTLQEWDNNPEFMGEYEPFRQETRADLERTYDDLKDAQWFFVQKKDGTKIGCVAHFLAAGEIELGYFIVPSERKKGYASEAIQIMVDYLFLSKDAVRVQAKATQKTLHHGKPLKRLGSREKVS